MSIINKERTMNKFHIQKISKNINQSKDKKDLNHIINTVSSIKETNFKTTDPVFRIFGFCLYLYFF